MYTQQEASRIRQKFWTSFGQYMRPVPAADGSQVNWINYKTGIKDVFFRMDADDERAVVRIEFRHKDGAMRQHYYNKFLEMEMFFREETGDGWVWKETARDDHGVEYSGIEIREENVNIYRESDWPGIIGFLKQNIMSLDRFWNVFKGVIE